MNKYELEHDLTERELRLAIFYVASGSIKDHSTSALSNLRSERMVCDGFCKKDHSHTPVIRMAGSDAKLTTLLINRYIQMGFSTACKNCEEKYFCIAQALEMHKDVNRKVDTGDDKGAAESAIMRGALLRSVGYKKA